jgi:RNA polymerase sigma-70 factor (ECF subfamily)
MRFGMRMCGQRDDAEDVVQEAMLAAVRNLPEFREEASVSTWLYAITRSFCIKKRRRSKFAPSREESLESEARGPARRLEHEGASPEEATLSAELDHAVQSAISTLEPGQREVLVLRDVEGLPAAEVAEITGLNVGAVKSKLHRARAALRRTLEPVLAEALEPAPTTSECPEVDVLFSEHLEGEIDAELCRRMQAHVDACPRCRQACKSLSTVLRVCQATPFPEVPSAVQASVRRELRRLEKSSR